MLLAAAAATRTLSAQDFWNDGTGNWSVGGNWLSGNVPAAGDTVNLTQSDATTRIVTFDAAATSGTGFTQLTIDATGSGSMSLYQATGTLRVSGTEYIGNSGTGSFVQTGGSNVTGSLQLGAGSNAVGLYTLSNSASLTVKSNEYIGYSGLGTFNQTGGTASINTLVLGANTGASGTYNLSGGNLAVNSGYIGDYGAGVLNVQGGTTTFGNLTVGYYSYATSVGSAGAVNLISGTLNATGSTIIGQEANGTLNLQGGLASFQNLTLAMNHAGTLTITNGASLSVAGNAYFGYSQNDAVVNQYGGAANFTGVATNALAVDGNGTNVGTWNMMGGTFSGTARTLSIGGNTGLFNQSGGSVNVANVAIGATFFCVDTYNVSGGALTVSSNLNVGYDDGGIDTFHQTGGTVTTTTLNVGAAGGTTCGSAAFYQLDGGTLNATGDENIGFSAGPGVFNQTSGLNNDSGIVLASSALWNGTYNLSGGTVSGNGILIVGGASGAVGNYNQTGGTADFLSVLGPSGGSAPYGTGNVNLSGGVFNVSGNLQTGPAPNGSINFTQTAGVALISGNLDIAHGSNSTAAFLVQGGTFSVGGNTYDGSSGTSSFIQTGGSVQLSAVNIAVNARGNGLLAIEGGTATATSLFVGGSSSGAGGTGVVSVAGGSLAVSGSTIVYAAAGTSGGTAFNVTGGGFTTASLQNQGLFEQSGGVTSLGTISGTGTLTVGGGTGAANMAATGISQGAATISPGGYLAVASNAAQATNTVTNLTITGSGQLDLANNNLITSTSPSTIRQYLIAGYNGGAWNGTGGISSINAAANTNQSTALGYTSGTSAVGIALGLGSNQTLIKYVHYGDANLDGTVGSSDLNIVLNNYLSGKPATWDTGDFTYAGKVDITDLNLTLSNYGATAATTVRVGGAAVAVAGASTAHTLTGVASPGIAPPPNGQLELIVYTDTGDVQLEGNNADIASLQITSASGGIVTANWDDLNSQGNGNWSDTARKAAGIGEYDNQFVVTGNSLLLNGIIDYGDIYNITTNAEDLVFEYGSVESNQTTVNTDVGVVYFIPEPTTLSLMGLAAVGLMSRRRRGVHILARTTQNNSNRK